MSENLSDTLLCACKGKEFGHVIERYHSSIGLLRTIPEHNRNPRFVKTLLTYLDSESEVLNKRCGFNIDRRKIMEASEDLSRGKFNLSEKKIMEVHADFERKCGARR